MIEAVLQSNLFVLPVGAAGKWIRYHHLFRDFLQSQLEREHPEEKEFILKRLAIVYAERGDWEKSYAIYQRLGDIESEADLVNRAGPFLLKSGRISTLVGWIDELPGDIVNSQPGLLSLRGGAAIMRGQVEQAITYLNQAEFKQRGSQDLSGLAVSLLRKATANLFLGKYSISLENASEALGLIGDSTTLLNVRAEALRAIGLIWQVTS